MKIAIIKRKYMSEGGGGAERYARMIANGLIQKGHTIYILAKNFIGEESVNLIHIPVPSSHGINSSGNTAFHKSVQKILPKERNKYNFDIVYSISRTYPSDIFRVTEQVHIEWMKLFYSSIQKMNPRHRGILNLEKHIFQLKSTKAVVSNSQLVKDLVVKHYGFPAERIHVLRNGIDRSIFFPPTSPAEKQKLRRDLISDTITDNTIVLSFTSENFKIKGLDFAIQAISKLKPELQNKTLLAVLGGDNPAEFQKLADSLGVGNNITFLGRHKNPRNFYASADLMLYPSMGEPFGNVCLEACACGVPVLTTECNGSCEVVDPGKNGYIISSASDVDKMTEYINDFIRLDSVEKDDFSKNAVQATEPYSWDKHVDQLEKLIQEVRLEIYPPKL